MRYQVANKLQMCCYFSKVAIVFIVFDHQCGGFYFCSHCIYGQLQTLTSLGISIFYCFCLHLMLHYRFLASVVRPNYGLGNPEMKITVGY